MFNKLFIAKSLFIFVLPFVLYADTCTVASGQTVAFTLSAGAKASWNNAIAGIHQWPAVLKNGTSFSVYQLSNGNIAFNTPGYKNDIPLRISLYSVNGRKIGIIAMSGRTSGGFAIKLVPGIYLARLDGGGIIQTTRFVMGR